MSRRIVTVSIDEGDLSLIRHIESAKIINNTPGEGFDPEGVPLPYSLEDVTALVDADGDAAVVIPVSLEAFGQGLAGDSSMGQDDIYDILHEIAFGTLGVTENSSYEVLGVVGNSDALLVRPTTTLGHFLREREEEEASA